MDGAELNQFIDFARPGATLRVNRNYELSGPLTISKPLTLIGDGAVHPTISFAGPGWSLMFVGEGPWRVEGIDFLHAGGMPGDVVRVSGGEFCARDCSFVGGVLEAHHGGGFGLALVGDTRADLAACAFSRNVLGLLATDRATAHVVDCRAYCNAFHGMQIIREAHVDFERNTLMSNGSCGLFAGNQTSGTARGNACWGNGGHGIQATQAARFDTIDNEVESSGSCGVAYFGVSSGLCAGNLCRRNGDSGIHAQAEASPRIERNRCTLNGRGGICVYGSARCGVRDNVCADNVDGVRVLETGSADLADNVCKGNRRHAIMVGAAATVSLDNNRGEVVYDDGDDTP